MAVREWQGDAAAVDQVDRITISTVANEFAYTVTIGGSTVTYTSTANATKLDIANGLIAAIASRTAPGQFRGVRAARAEPSPGNYTVDVRSGTAGEPFDLSVGTNLSAATLQQPTGPNDVANVSNWGGALPQTGDEIVIRDTPSSLLWNLDVLEDVEAALLRVLASFTGRIGLPSFNASAADAVFAEYRGTHLRLKSDQTVIGEGAGEGSPLIRLDLNGHANAAVLVRSTGAAGANYGALQLIGTGAGSTLDVTRGSVDVAWQTGETATFAEVSAAFETSPDTDAVVRLGPGTTVADVDAIGGALTIACATSLVTASGGALAIHGGAHASIALTGTASVDYRSSGTIASITAGDGNTVDFSRDPQPKTVTSCTVRKGARISDPGRQVTWTNGIALDGCGLTEVVLDLGKGHTIQIS